jgi:plasmid stabilization system protein ParE
MSFELIIRPEAEADALEAFRWYNEQVPGLGQEFLAEIDRAIESILAHPEANRKLYREYRRGLMRRFPYSIFYAIDGERLVVFAVLHAARDPRVWRRRGKDAL